LSNINLTVSHYKHWFCRFLMMKMRHIRILTLHHYFDGGIRLDLSEWRSNERRKKSLIKQSQG